MAEQGAFAGSSVVVTGGGGGIGTAICRRFAAAGADVVADRNERAAQGTARDIQAAGGSATAWPVDVTDAAAAGRLFTALGESRPGLDVLVNCAARASDTAFGHLFLASPDASWITGQTLAVDGGITAGHSGLIDAISGADAGEDPPS